MNTEKSPVLGTVSTQNQSDHFYSHRGLKRKFDTLLRQTIQEGPGYPSPPMSAPPTPSRALIELSSTTTEGRTSTTAPSTTNISLPGLPTTTPSVPFSAPPPPPGSGLYLSPFQAHTSGPSTAQTTAPSIFQLGGYVTTAPTVTVTSSVADQSLTRTGRKSRGHVASACVNCKKAHLSCDVQRPCARCVASGKQETCVDVQHKKRGRPRLREEGEFKVEQMLPGPVLQPPTTTASSPISARPIAGTRHRRTESLRSLRSQTSDSSGPSALPTPTFPPPSSGIPRFGLQPPTYPSVGAGSVEIPTAYLDLDLIFIRANNAFQHLMAGGQNIARRRLDDIAMLADSNDFQSIRNQLREEREARDPSYMPPILHPSQDPLQGVAHADIDKLTQGFTDRTYIWTSNQPGASRERFTVRIRLARANVYFVAVTLPPVRLQLPPSSPYGTPVSTVAESYQSYGPAAYPTTPRYYGTQQTVGGPQFQHQPFVGQPLPPTYYLYQPPPPTSQSYQPLRPPITPRMGPEGAAESATFTPPTARREPLPPPHGSYQLPPIGSGPPISSARSTSTTTGHQPQRFSSPEDEGDDERSPRKRRRVGIDDVLQ